MYVTHAESDTKLTTEGTLLLHDAGVLGGSRLQILILSGTRGLMNLTLAATMETQLMVLNLWHD